MRRGFFKHCGILNLGVGFLKIQALDFFPLFGFPSAHVTPLIRNGAMEGTYV